MLVPAWLAIQRAFDNQRVLLVWPVAQVARRWVQRFATLGTPTPFVLALYEGPSEPLPLPASHQFVLLPGDLPELDADDRLFDRWEAAMADLPAEARAAVEAWDPDRTAVVLVPPASTLREVAGRRVFGGTSPHRAEIENKALVDALFAKMGVRTLPYAVVAPEAAPAAAARLDAGHGTVWAADNTKAIEAGAQNLLHVHNTATRDHALARFAGRHASVRVQPFVPGVPCSIQGICTPDGVALTRPSEMVVLRNPSSGAFWLLGMATTWDPPPEVTAALMVLARTVGEYLRQNYDWRGGFSVDTIASPDGTLWPTEINARMSAGLALADGVLPGPSLELVERLLREKLPIDTTAAHLERWMRPPLNARRIAHIRVKPVPCPDQKHVLTVAFHPIREVPPDSAEATIEWAAEGCNGVIRVEWSPLRTPRGNRLGPSVAAALSLAAQVWGVPTDGWCAA